MAQVHTSLKVFTAGGLKDALALLKESYGYSYSDADEINSRLKLKFENDSTVDYLAYVFYDTENHDFKEFESRILCVNMAKFKNMSSSDHHGTTANNRFGLDRTLVHELTYGIMASNVNYYNDLPNVLIAACAAADVIKNYSSNVTINGGSGKDTLHNEGDHVSISGGAGNDEIYNSHAYYPTIKGGAGNDTLDGGADNDKLYGGAGADKLFGGNGNDTFIFQAGGGSITFENVTTTTDFNINGKSYKISGSKLVKK